MIDITNILEAVLALLAAILTSVIIPAIIQNIGKDKMKNIAYWVKIGVAAAEQIYKGYEKSGVEKKNYVLTFLQAQNITYDEGKINALIEAAVLELTNEAQN